MMADSTSHVEQDPVGTQKSGNDQAVEWRVEQYLAMQFEDKPAFNEAQARALAASTTTSYTGGKSKNDKKLEWTIPLDWKKVQEALTNGCDPDLAIQIFSTVDNER